MKTTFLLLMSLIAYSQVGAATTIQARSANDYVLLDTVESISLVSSTNLPAIIGSKAVFKVKGKLGVRGCPYNGFSFFLQPMNGTGDLNFEKYNVTVQPMFFESVVEFSSRKCSSISMGVESFEADFQVAMNEWLGGERTWVYSFLGTGGVKLKIIQITYTPAGGWKMKEI